MRKHQRKNSVTLGLAMSSVFQIFSEFPTISLHIFFPKEEYFLYDTEKNAWFRKYNFSSFRKMLMAIFILRFLPNFQRLEKFINEISKF